MFLRLHYYQKSYAQCSQNCLETILNTETVGVVLSKQPNTKLLFIGYRLQHIFFYLFKHSKTHGMAYMVDSIGRMLSHYTYHGS